MMAATTPAMISLKQNCSIYVHRIVLFQCHALRSFFLDRPTIWCIHNILVTLACGWYAQPATHSRLRCKDHAAHLVTVHVPLRIMEEVLNVPIAFALLSKWFICETARCSEWSCDNMKEVRLFVPKPQPHQRVGYEIVSMVVSFRAICLIFLRTSLSFWIYLELMNPSGQGKTECYRNQRLICRFSCSGIESNKENTQALIKLIAMILLVN